jgi:hypothetical protein
VQPPQRRKKNATVSNLLMAIINEIQIEMNMLMMANHTEKEDDDDGEGQPR